MLSLSFKSSYNNGFKSNKYTFYKKEYLFMLIYDLLILRYFMFRIGVLLPLILEMEVICLDSISVDLYHFILFTKFKNSRNQ